MWLSNLAAIFSNNHHLEVIPLNSKLKTILGDILLAGETLAPVWIHNAKSQQMYLVLTTDVNALYSQIFGTGQTATTTPTGS